MLVPSWAVNPVGYVAATATTLSFVPQLVRVLRVRSAREISLSMFLIFSAGVFLWLLYGLSIHSWPVIASNGITFVLALSILLLKIHYDRKGSSLGSQ